MKFSLTLLTIYFALNLKFCGKNESNNSSSETEIITNSDEAKSHLLVLADLKHILLNNLTNENSICAYLKTIDNKWKLQGTENEEIIFSINQNSTCKEMLSFHHNHNILEYITFDDNHFFRYIKDFENQNFDITKTSVNEYGGNVSNFSDGKIFIITEEIPMTETGKNAHKILIAQKK